MDILHVLLNDLLTNPAIQSAALGLVVKLGVDLLKKWFVEIDADGNKKYKVEVQLLVAVCTLAASLGDLYVKGQLHTEDPHILTDFLTVTLPVYLNALGIHLFANNMKKDK